MVRRRTGAQRALAPVLVGAIGALSACGGSSTGSSTASSSASSAGSSASGTTAAATTATTAAAGANTSAAAAATTAGATTTAAVKVDTRPLVVSGGKAYDVCDAVPLDAAAKVIGAPASLAAQPLFEIRGQAGPMGVAPSQPEGSVMCQYVAKGRPSFGLYVVTDESIRFATGDPSASARQAYDAEVAKLARANPTSVEGVGDASAFVPGGPQSLVAAFHAVKGDVWARLEACTFDSPLCADAAAVAALDEMAPSVLNAVFAETAAGNGEPFAGWPTLRPAVVETTLGSGTKVDVCSLADPALVAAVVGTTTALDPPVAAQGFGGTTVPSCAWAPRVRANDAPLVYLAVKPGDTDASFQEAKAKAKADAEANGEPPVEAPVVGDAAYWRGDLLWVRAKGTTFVVTRGGFGLAQSPRAPAAVALAAAVVAKL